MKFKQALVELEDNFGGTNGIKLLLMLLLWLRLLIMAILLLQLLLGDKLLNPLILIISHHLQEDHYNVDSV
jgi:hypothetical protein